MNRTQARKTARELLNIMPLVMRTVAAGLRSAGELPAPVHFGLLTKLSEQPRTLTELATLWGVSLPTMSNSITALVQRGWVQRITPGLTPFSVTSHKKDRRMVTLEITAAGRAALERVGRSAERRIAEVLAPLDAASRRRMQAGLTVLRKVFAAPAAATARRQQRSARAGD